MVTFHEFMAALQARRAGRATAAGAPPFGDQLRQLLLKSSTDFYNRRTDVRFLSSLFILLIVHLSVLVVITSYCYRTRGQIHKCQILILAPKLTPS